MPITKAEVLDVLNDLRLRNIRFSVGPINVDSVEYDKVVDYIESGAIKVVPGKNTYSLYIPQINTLRTRSGDPPLNNNARSNLLHECTHAISDINKVNVTRLTDEAAAYLAQFAYLLLLEPSLEEPPIGPPLNNMMRQGMQLVRKYNLGKPAGFGASIAQSDISNLAQALHTIPDYGDINEKAKLAADGVALSNEQEEEFFRLQVSRIGKQILNDLMAEDMTHLLTLNLRGVSYENYVTWDRELLTLFDLHARGGVAQKKAAQQRLLRIFLTIDQSSAMRLLQRLSTLKQGDIVSTRFQSGFPSPMKSALLSALQLTR